MTMWIFGIVLACLLVVLTLVSYVERLYTETGKFLSREFQENIEQFELKIEPRLGVGRERASLSMTILEQLSLAMLSLMVAFTVFTKPDWNKVDVGQGIAVIVVIIVIFNRVMPYVLFARTRGDWLVSFVPLLKTLIYLAVPITLIVAFCQSVTSLSKEHAEPEPEHPSEAVDALIEAGQEEGILQESDRELIQSVVEFNEKTVREVMKPRPDIVAIEASCNIEQLTELLNHRPYSRIPVYEGTIDNMIGVVQSYDVLQISDSVAGKQGVRSIMKPGVHFVPESKRISDLLREMQRDNIRLQMVIDEYGAIAGLVTIEDLVEEIVGEIRDEHESVTDVIKENANSYVVSGNVDVDLLDNLFGVRLEGHEATTVAGLVSEISGHIPQRGEIVEDSGLRFEVLDSTDRKITRLRITPKQPETESSVATS